MSPKPPRESIWQRYLRLVRRDVEGELAEELRLHIELRTRELVATGLDPETAHARAMERFGNYKLVERECLALDRREVAMERRTEWLGDFTRDLRHAARGLRRRPAFAVTAIVSLAIGIGVVATVFSVGRALLQPIPGTREPERLVSVYRTDAHGNGVDAVSYTEFSAALATAQPFSGAAAFAVERMSLRTPDGPAREVSAVLATANYFTVLGVRSSSGRLFAARGVMASPEIVISYGFWQRRFAGDPSIIGRAVVLNGRLVTVVGIIDRDFTGTLAGLRVDLWAPIGLRPELVAGPNPLTDRTGRFLEVIARLREGVTRESVAAALAPATAVLARMTPRPEAPNGVGLRIAPARLIPDEGHGAAVGFTSMLGGIALLVLAIAGLNVAGVLLAHAAARRREMAVRIAMGAGRGRLVRQLLAESILLFAGAGGCGAAVAWGLLSLLAAYHPPLGLPFELHLQLDRATLALTMALALVAGTLFGLTPALESLRTDVRAALTGSGASTRSRRWQVRHLLIIAQVAGSMVMLVVAALFARSLERARDVPMGFDPNGVVVADLDFGAAGYTAARGRAALGRIDGMLRAALPGATIGTAELLPLALSRHASLVNIDGEPSPAGQPGFPTDQNVVGASYFRVLGIPLIAGRAFTAFDSINAPRVAIVNETFARWHFPGGDALGRRIHVGDPSTLPYEIVGVATDAKYRTLGEAPTAFVYLSAAQQYTPRVSMLVRSPLGGAATMAAIRRAVTAAGPEIPLPAVTPLSSVVQITLTPQRFAAAAASALGVVGLLLAALGLYGALAYAVVQRTKEIGVRLAIGARPIDVTTQFLREGMRMAVVGVVLGLAMAVALGRLLASFLFGVSASDPVAIAGVLALLGTVMMVASWLPARRAARLDPATTLRSE